MTYTVEDLPVEGSKWMCPVEGCVYIGNYGPGGALEHANKPHERCVCGWVGLQILKHLGHVERKQISGRHAFLDPGEDAAESAAVLQARAKLRAAEAALARAKAHVRKMESETEQARYRLFVQEVQAKLNRPVENLDLLWERWERDP